MAMPGLVLIHGGGHAADCWDLTVDEIQALEPNVDVLAVDLPGRRGKPGDLRADTIADWVDSVVRDIEHAGLTDVVIAGHSMAGLTMPGVTTALGVGRVRELVFVAAMVPPEGSSLTAATTGPLGWLARRRGGNGEPGHTPAWVVRFSYCNGMPGSGRAFVQQRIYPESGRVIAEKVSRRDLPSEVPRTWVLTLRDRALPVKTQCRSIAALGGVQTLIPVDACHAVMVSEPRLLAEILVERCRRHC